jgi:hypothetical protein
MMACRALTGCGTAALRSSEPPREYLVLVFLPLRLSKKFVYEETDEKATLVAAEDLM